MAQYYHVRSPGWSLNIVLQWTPLPVVAPDKSVPLVATKKSTFPYHWGMQIITITALRITLKYNLSYLDFPSTQILTKQSLGLNFRPIFIPTSELVLSNSAWSKSSSLQFKKGLAHLANRIILSWDFNLEIPLPSLESPVANKGVYVGFPEPTNVTSSWWWRLHPVLSSGGYRYPSC